ncbi:MULTISPECIES: HAD family hydrolase [Halorussus]|uniref:HAD family hydrolase n=1 Tax=Halorussus TaxID=1070314 RepID=UPI00209F076C|nr:HAD family hydrolase [Halorussus vallis]USZ78303.1 HAD family hydrolase [Halorussus vallis]
MTYDALLFDVDGVLLDRHADHPGVYRWAVAATFDEFGVAPADAELDVFISGATVEGMRRVCSDYDIEFKSFWERREANASDLQCGMMDRGERVPYDDCKVVRELAAEHVMGVVSNNQHATVEYMLRRFDLAHAFDAVYGRAPTVEGFRLTKPNTHYVERAMSDLDVADGLYVGDSSCDVIAAHRAGLDSVFVRRSHRKDYSLSEEPTYEITSLAGLSDLSGVALSSA